MKRVLTTMLILICGLGLELGTAKADIYNGLVAWYTLDSNDISGTTVTDKSGNGNTGTTVNSPTPVPGVLGQALSFDGSSQYAKLGYSPTTALPVTISAWFKTTSSGVIFGDANAVPPSSATGYNPLLYVRSDNKLSGGIYNGGATPVNMFASANSVSDGKWHFGALVVTSGGTETLYLDGSSVGSVTGGGAQATTNSFIGVGYTNLWYGGNSSWYYFPGSIDDVRIYNRALSAAEVQQLYYMHFFGSNSFMF